MAPLTYRFPITVQITGEIPDTGFDDLAESVRRAVTERIAAAERQPVRAAGSDRGPLISVDPVEERARERSGPGVLGRYDVPSYDRQGVLVALPAARPAPAVQAPPDDPSAALRRIHELMHPGWFHGGVSASDAVAAIRLLEGLSLIGRLDALTRMRLSGEWAILGRSVAARDRARVDALTREADPAIGVIVVGDIVRLEWSFGGALPGQYDALFDVDGAGNMRLPWIKDAIHVAGLLPLQAANAIAQAYLDGGRVIASLTLAPVRRGGAYGGVAIERPVVVESTISRKPATSKISRLDEFRNFISYVRPVGKLAEAAVRLYNKEVDDDPSRWASPPELWAWALRRAYVEAPAPPVQRYLELARLKTAEAEKAAAKEKQRIVTAVNKYLEWVLRHGTDPRLGTDARGYGPGEVYARFYVAVFKEDVEREVTLNVALEKIRRAEERDHQRWEQFGPVLDAALEHLKRRVWRPPDPEIAEDRENLVGWLILPSEAEMQVRAEIGRQYLHDLLAIPDSNAPIPDPGKIEADFQRWLRGRPELLEAYLLTESHPYVEKYAIEVDIPAWQTATEVIISFIPIIGQIVGGYEAIGGKDLFNNKLSATDRTIIGVTLLLPEVWKLYKGGRGLLAADEMVRTYHLLPHEADYAYRMAVGLGPGSHAAGLFTRAAEDIRAGHALAPDRIVELEQTLKDLGMTDEAALRAFNERPQPRLRGIDPAVERDIEREFAEIEGVDPTGLFPTTQKLIRGNLGERLAADALAKDGHVVISYKPEITGTNQGGIDMVTLRGDTVYLVDNKALSRGGNVASVSALTTNLNQNIAAVQRDLAAMLADADRSAAERKVLQDALDALTQGRYVKAVTNANVVRSESKILKGVTDTLANKGIRFINVFP